MRNLVFFFLLICSFVKGQGWDCNGALQAWDTAPGNYAKKNKVIHEIIAQAASQRELSCLCDAYRRLGILYRDNMLIDSAMIVYINSATLADSLDDKVSYASTCNQIASLYYDLGDDSQALQYFEKAFAAYKDSRADARFRGMADASMNMGWVHCERNELAVAKRLCFESINYREKYGIKTGAGSNYDLLADIYYRQKKFSQSQVYSQKAIDILQKEGNTRQIIPALIQVGIAHMDNRQPDSAVFYLSKAFVNATEDEDPRHISDVANYLYQAFDQKKQKDSALHYLKLYSSYKDNLFKDLVLVTATEAGMRYQTHKKDQQLLSQREEINSTQQTAFIFILFSAFLIFVIVILTRNFSQRKKIQKKESELENANAMLQGQDEERERIAMELHDRVGSMLSTVKLHFSAMDEHMGELIKQQGQSYTKAIRLLDETYEEVRRISHDLDTGLLGRFGFKTAMLQLIQVLESTNKIKVLYLDNNLEQELYKPYETDLYRITQELLSNTIKYASAKEISIQLSTNSENLVYSYEDDGAGFEKSRIDTELGIGYKNINSRVKKMNGKWHLDTSPGHGINLIIEIPLHGKKIRVIIADDHLLFSDGLTTILENAGFIHVIGSAANGEELLKLLAKEQADLVMLDISMPGMNGLQAAEKIKSLYAEIKILVVTMNDSVDMIRSLMDTGVNGIVLKNTGKTEFLLAIREICEGNTYFSQKITQQLAKAYQVNSQDKWQLTKREREVLHLIYEGLSTGEIAEKLFISVYTVETHKKNLFLKSGVNKSSLLVKHAQELGYIKARI